jgi:hypothetical protein
MSGAWLLPALDAPASAWRAACVAFTARQQANGRTTTGLFAGLDDKRAFCGALAAMLRDAEARGAGGGAGATSGARWPAETVLQALVCERAVLCDRDEALAPLQGSLDVLAGLLRGFVEDGEPGYGSAVAREAVKCLNNALFEHEENQRAFAALPAERGALALLPALAFGARCDHAGLVRTLHVCMHLTAGKQEPAGGAGGAPPLSRALAEAAIAALVSVAAGWLPAAPGSGGLDLFAGPEQGRPAREAICAGLRFVYAAAASHPQVPAALLAESRAWAAARSGGSEAALAALAARLSLADADAPALDRLGLLLVALLGVAPQEAPERQQAVDEVQDEAVTVVMVAAELGFADFFAQRGGVLCLTLALARRMAAVLGDAPTAQSVQYYKDMLPWVIAATNLCSLSPRACQVVKQVVFPAELPLPDLAGLADDEIERLANLRKMEGNTPKDCLGNRLITFMTCLDSNLKRYAGELLYTLCGSNAGEMTRRCGYGHSAHILAIKGGTIGAIIKEQDERERKEGKQ